jgi:hypothetical protein
MMQEGNIQISFDISVESARKDARIPGEGGGYGRRDESMIVLVGKFLLIASLSFPIPSELEPSQSYIGAIYAIFPSSILNSLLNSSSQLSSSFRILKVGMALPLNRHGSLYQAKLCVLELLQVLDIK